MTHDSNATTSADRSDIAAPATDQASNTYFASLGKYDTAVVTPHTRMFIAAVRKMAGNVAPGTRVLDVGCGLGAIAADFAARGCTVVGIDLDEDNLQVAQRAYQAVRFVHAAANEQVLETLNEPPFDIVVCTEVIEHVYSPQSLVAGCHRALKPGGQLIISAPYHAYLKNLVIALLNKCDAHYAPLWEGGHIKFFSRATMGELLSRSGFENITSTGVGRVPGLRMSLVMSGRRAR